MSTETRELRCELTEADINERAKEAATLWIEVAKLEGERRGINEAIKPRKERMDVLAYIVESGMEDRMVECYWVYDWANRIKFLHRGDNGKLLEQQPIRDHEKQIEMELAPKAPAKVFSMFDPCPSGPCVMVKNGSTCAPAFCGKNPPAGSSLKQLFKIDAATCEHPIGMRFQDSNALICEACGTVLETFSTEPQLAEVEPSNAGGKQEGPTICFNTACKSYSKAEANGCTLLEYAWECGNVVEQFVGETASTAEIAEIVNLHNSASSASLHEVTQATDTPDKDRACCMPFDREWVKADGISIMYCTKCLLIHRKIDKRTDKEIDFIVGEKLATPDFDAPELWPVGSAKVA